MDFARDVIPKVNKLVWDSAVHQGYPRLDANNQLHIVDDNVGGRGGFSPVFVEVFSGYT